MKLKIDCVRDVLLEFETFPFGCYTVYSFKKTLAKYTFDDVLYSLAKLKEAGFINADMFVGNDGQPDFLGIYDISYAGHDFLYTIREPSVWDKLSDAAQSGGTASLKLIGDFALEFAKLAIAKKLGMQ